MAILYRLLFALAFVSTINIVHGFIEGLYCGEDNCYELLGVDIEASRTEIVKAYRKLARKWHPDMHKGKEEKEAASKMFQKIANAYEILRDEDQRNDYNYMLEHPEEYYYNYYRYYRRRVAPKVDVRIVIAVTITVISVVQYYGAWSNYTQAIAYLCKEQKYRLRAQHIAKSEGLLPVAKKNDSKRKSKEEIKEEEEAIIRKVILEKMDIRGGYRKPELTDVLWLQLLLSPYYLVLYIIWWVKWVWRFNIKGEEYGEEEKLYLIRKNMKLSQTQFNSLEDENIDDYLHRELWIKEKFQEWKKEQEEEMKIKMAQSGRMKGYRRYMKKGGPGQMTFGPE